MYDVIRDSGITFYVSMAFSRRVQNYRPYSSKLETHVARFETFCVNSEVLLPKCTCLLGELWLIKCKV